MTFLSLLQKTAVVSALLFSATTHAANQKPIANAGADQNVTFSNTVLLSGTQSRDADGEIKKYQWQQTKGTKVTLKNAKTATASFDPATLFRTQIL